MSRRWVVGGAALLAVSSAATAADNFCAELDHTIAAVRSGSIERLPKAAPRGFGFNFCGVQGPGYFCHQALAPDSLSLDLLSASILACRPSLVRTSPPSSEWATIDGDGVHVWIAESGGTGAKVGRIVSLSIEPAKR